MVIEWALSFALGLFTAFFLMVVFGIRPFRGRRVRAEDPFKGAIERRLSSGPFIVAAVDSSRGRCAAGVPSRVQ